MITDVFRRVSRSPQGENSPTTRLSDVQLYYDLARASGGQAVQVSKSDLPLATGIIEDSSAGAVVRAREADRGRTPSYWMRQVDNDCVSVFQVTVFQVVRNPGRPDQFTFTVDSSLINVTIYITGLSPLTFNLTDPSGGISRHLRPFSQLVSAITCSCLIRRSDPELRSVQRSAGLHQRGWKSASAKDLSRRSNWILEDPGGFG